MMKTKKICIDVRMAFHAGIGTYIRNILPYLKKSNLSIQLLAPLSYVEKWPELTTYDLIPTNAPIYSIQEQIELPLKIPRCDLFWSPHYSIPLAPIRAHKRLTTIHDVNHLALTKPLGWHQKNYAKIMMHQATRRSDAIITISRFSKDEIVQWTKVDSQKVSVIHLGVDQDKFSRHEKETTFSKYFLFVSTLSPHKNVERLLQAWEIVKQRYPEWELLLVGKKTKHVETLDFADNVRLLEQVSDEELIKLYLGAYALISPSLYEGFGLPLLEAMSIGCPTVVSHASSYPEVCDDAALYFNPLDEKDMAQKICSLIENPSIRQALIVKGKKRIDRFSWEKSANYHLEVISRLLG